MFNKTNLTVLVMIGLIAGAFGIMGFMFWNQNADSPQTTMVQYSNENPLQNKHINAEAITFNNITLHDDTQYVPEINVCYAQRNGFAVLISPCVAQDVDGKNIQQSVGFGWNGTGQRNISLIFVYEGELESGNVKLMKNVTINYEETTYEEAWANNKLIDKVITYTNLGLPDERCTIGNQNNTHMYEVYRNNGLSDVPEIYCFTDFQAVNTTSFRVSGNYNKEIKVPATRYEMQYVDVTDKFQFLGKGLLNDERSYYKVEGATFNPGDDKRTLWTYTPKGKVGKWHILAYDEDYGLINSIVNDKYLYIDPWWDNSWLTKRLISNLTGNIVTINISYQTGMQTGFGDVRFISADETTELPYALINVTLGTNAIYKVQTNGSSTMYMYYDNAGASYNGNIQSVYNSALRGAWFFEGNFGDTYLPASQNATPTTVYISGADNNVSYYDMHTNASGRAVVAMADPTEYSWIVFAKRVADGSIVAWKDGGSSTLKFLRWESSGANIVHQIGQGGSYSINSYAISGSTNWHFYYAGGKVSAGNMVCINSASQCQNASLTAMGNSADELDIGGLYSGTYQNEMSGQVDDLVLFNRVLTGPEINYFANQTKANYILGSAEVSSGISVLLSYPANSQEFPTTSIFFNATLVPAQVNNTNATIYVWNSSNSLIYNETNIVLGNETNVTNWTHSFSYDDVYTWNVYGCGSDGVTTVCAWNTNRTFSIDTTAPSILINSPTSNQFFISPTFPYNVTLNVTSSDVSLDSCWYSTSTNATNITYACNTLTNVSFNSYGNKTIYVYANDSVGTLASGNVPISIATYSQSQSTSSIAEGSTATFTLIVNMTNIPSTSAYFKYNNTNYAPSTQSNTQNATVFTYDLTIPSGYGNQSGKTQYWNWTFNITGFVTGYNTTTQSQTVFTVDFDDCSLYPVLAYNLTLYDEATQTLVNASAGANIQVDLTWTANSGVEFTKSFENTNNNTMLICVPANILNGTSFSVDMTAQYSATDKVVEFYYIDNGTISNNTIPEEIKLYDLALDDSTTFLFTYLDENGIEVPGVIVETFRYYVGQGQFIEVERSKEDNNGETHVHLVEEDVIYKFIVTLANQEIFESTQYNAKCLSSPCSITLTSQPELPNPTSVYDNLPEGSYAITTDKSTRQVTLYFNLNQTETMNLTIYNSDNNEIQAVASGTTSASSGSVTVTVPLAYGNATYYATVEMGDQFVGSRYVDLTEDGSDYFGALGLLLGALAILTLALIGASHGEWVIVWTIVGLLTAGLMYLVDLPWYAITTFIAGAGIFVIKLVARRRVQ